MKTIPQREHGSTRRPMRRGFTLLELLVVIVIIGILAAVLLGTYQAARNAAWKMKARDTARQIATAWNVALVQSPTGFPARTAFVSDPTYDTDPNAITFETTTNNMNVLDAMALQNANQIYIDRNAQQRIYGMTDKWGRYYHVRLDANYDGMINSPLDSTPIRANVMVWSIGPYPNTPANSWVMIWPQ